MKPLDKYALNDLQEFNSLAKRAAFRAVETAYGEVWIIAKTDAPGVELPKSATAKHPSMIPLQLSDRLARPTRAFCDETGVRFDASFDRVMYACFVPWHAVCIVRSPVSDDGEVEHSFGWSPVETEASAPSAVNAAGKQVGSVGARVRPGSKLRVIKGGAS